MGATYDRELRQLLLDSGCYLIRQGKGSHERWYSPITKSNFTVPVNIVNRHTANGVLKQAGLPKAF